MSALLNYVEIAPKPWCDGGNEETYEDWKARAVLAFRMIAERGWMFFEDETTKDGECRIETFGDFLPLEEREMNLELAKYLSEQMGGHDMIVSNEIYERAKLEYERALQEAKL